MCMRRFKQHLRAQLTALALFSDRGPILVFVFLCRKLELGTKRSRCLSLYRDCLFENIAAPFESGERLVRQGAGVASILSLSTMSVSIRSAAHFCPGKDTNLQ